MVEKSANTKTVEAVRRPYRKPALVQHGNLSEITLGTFTKGKQDAYEYKSNQRTG